LLFKVACRISIVKHYSLGNQKLFLVVCDTAQSNVEHMGLNDRCAKLNDADTSLDAIAVITIHFCQCHFS
jgi:hypothetical protein